MKRKPRCKPRQLHQAIKEMELAKQLHVPREGHYHPDAKSDDYEWYYEQHPELRSKSYRRATELSMRTNR